MKKLISLILFCICTILSVHRANDILVDKSYNRYYMMEKELEERDETYDVQIYGSCHAYTSYNPMVLIEEYGISSYNLANPSEIIPVTYVRMKEQFEEYVPKVVLVDIWGTNAYDTYIKKKEIFGDYLRYNVERLPISKEKIELIKDFKQLDMLEDNFPMAKYKGRVLDFSLTKTDFNYSFELSKSIYDSKNINYVYNEMEKRLKNNGYKPLIYNNMWDYPQLQGEVAEDDVLEVEKKIMKYIDKIIELCDEKDVELIFYRAPYVAKENELRKANYLEQYFEECGVAYYDLEKELEFSYYYDFCDHQHLSKNGAEKTTAFLNELLLERLEMSN